MFRKLFFIKIQLVFITSLPSAAGFVGDPDGDASDAAVDDGHEDGGGEHGDHGVSGEEAGHQPALRVPSQVNLNTYKHKLLAFD